MCLVSVKQNCYRLVYGRRRTYTIVTGNITAFGEAVGWLLLSLKDGNRYVVVEFQQSGSNYEVKQYVLCP